MVQIKQTLLKVNNVTLKLIIFLPKTYSTVSIIAMLYMFFHHFVRYVGC